MEIKEDKEKKHKEKHLKSDKTHEKAEMEKLTPELEAAKKEAQENKDIAQRIKAEFDNYKKRILKESEDNIKLATEGLLTELLPVLDSFERAMAVNNIEDDKFKSFYSGMELILKKIQDILTNCGLKEISPVKGDEFDPAFHEAMLVETNAGYQDDVVLELFEKGYLLSNKLIRPAKVKVGKPSLEDTSNNVDARHK